VTDAERKQVEQRLDERLEELKRLRLAVRGSGAGMRDSEFVDVDQHPADRATELHDEELDETEQIFFDEEEARVAEARDWLAEGSYGTCKNCGREIPRERLAAAPEAVRCIDCQRHFEGLHRQRTRA
jgi:RNA polymerase-binding transcription factor DksA